MEDPVSPSTIGTVFLNLFLCIIVSPCPASEVYTIYTPLYTQFEVQVFALCGEHE